MKSIIKTVVIVLFSFALFSCSRDDNNKKSAQPASQGFKWRENDPAAAEQTAASAKFQASSLFALDANGNTLFEINLMTGSSAGTYTIDGDYIHGVALVYTTANFNATSGTIKITEKTAAKISGTFEAHGTGTGTGAGLTKIYGTFTDIPVQ